MKIAKDKEVPINDFKQLEKEYWNIVEHNMGSTVKVEYANDLDVSKFGSGFGRKDQKLLSSEQAKYVNHPWNLNNFSNNLNSLLQFKGADNISGINLPWLYVGNFLC
jgi:hypothetical protein